MSNQSISMDAPLYSYLQETSSRESDLLRELREETARDPMARMQIAPEQGQFMALLVSMIGARNVIEIGTFTGYSSICMAQNMVRPATVVCCDVSEEWTRIAQRYWQRAGVDDICDLRLQPALETLQELKTSKKVFDMAFIDADKANYDHYYEACLSLVRRNGLILIDNTLWGGRVVDPRVNDADTLAIRKLNAKLKQDTRVQVSQLPIADGLTLCLRR